VAEAVLTPRNKDLESGLRTRDCTAHKQKNIRDTTARKAKKRSRETLSPGEQAKETPNVSPSRMAFRAGGQHRTPNINFRNDFQEATSLFLEFE
jgi:hypothetical protein